DAEAAHPALYGPGTYELYWRDGAWRVAVRYWRPAAPAPVARTLATAIKRPLGHARTPEDARALLGQPAERVSDVLRRRDLNRKTLMARWARWVEDGLADIIERDGKLAISVTYWRPTPPPGTAAPLTAGERTELAQRIAAPLRSDVPQAPMDIGLFERPA